MAKMSRCTSLLAITLVVLICGCPPDPPVVRNPDVDGSGALDYADIQHVVHAAVGIVTGFDCDVDDDGIVSESDVQLVTEAVLGQTTPPEVPEYTYIVVNTFPHDKAAFTQGLVYEGGVLYEGTGLYGKSSLRKVELETGNVLQTKSLSAKYFGEGIAVFGDRIFQLTWTSRVGFVYQKSDFVQLDDFDYDTEGWGLTHNGTDLIMSDGTSRLYFINPETLIVTRTIEVRDDNGLVTRLNELEYVMGEVYANVWQTDRIARIAPQTGRVIGWIDLTGVLPEEDRDASTDVLNGIAYDATEHRLFVTGKRWPKLFEIQIGAKV